MCTIKLHIQRSLVFISPILPGRTSYATQGLHPNATTVVLTPPERASTAKGPKVSGAEGRFSNWRQQSVVCLCSKACKCAQLSLCDPFLFSQQQVAPKSLSLPTNPSLELHVHFQANYIPFCFKEQYPPPQSSPGDLCLRAMVP